MSAMLGLKTGGVAAVTPGRQAVARRSRSQVRADPQLRLHLAGDDGVLVIAEDRLGLLHLLGEPAGLRADRSRQCLTGVGGS